MDPICWYRVIFCIILHSSILCVQHRGRVLYRAGLYRASIKGSHFINIGQCFITYKTPPNINSFQTQPQDDEYGDRSRATEHSPGSCSLSYKYDLLSKIRLPAKITHQMSIIVTANFCLVSNFC